uniref:U17-Liphistoxin-Lsp1a_1 n=1 Tax=Liphistius sp. SGP-2016 TaxID=1905180 RepID=A0A4Q8K3X0_9ARAC
MLARLVFNIFSLLIMNVFFSACGPHPPRSPMRGCPCRCQGCTGTIPAERMRATCRYPPLPSPWHEIPIAPHTGPWGGPFNTAVDPCSNDH